MAESESGHLPGELPHRAGPETYVVRVRGRLSPRDVERLGGLVVETISEGGAQVTTTLRGRLADQSALIGVLNTLHGWQIPVLEITTVTGDETAS